MLSQLFLPRKAADDLIMASCCRTARGFSIIHGQKLLMLCWRSFLGHISDVVARVFAYKDGE